MFIKGQVSIKRCQNFLWKEDVDEENVQTVDKGSKLLLPLILASLEILSLTFLLNIQFLIIQLNKRIN